MASLEGIRLKIKRKYIHKTAKSRKRLIELTDFTIISNNCWGGFVYQSYDLPYNSPTIGLYLMADDYIKFISNLKGYTSCELEFINPKDSKYSKILKNDNRFGTYPIGKLNDIEVIFLHYTSELEAYEKWKRRCERINWDNLLVKFNDQNGCTYEHLNCFENLKFKNKVCFTSRKYSDLSSMVFIKSAERQEFVYASQEPIGKSTYIDINKLINTL